MKEGTEMKTMTSVEMMWSVSLFFFKAAQMPRASPKGTEMTAGQMFTLTVVSNLESVQLVPMISFIASTLGEILLDKPQDPWNKPFTQTKNWSKIGF